MNNQVSPAVEQLHARSVSDWKTRLLLTMALALGTTLLYAPAIRNDFVNFDDQPFVLKNLHVQQGLTISSMKWAFREAYEATWNPLTWISHMADVQFYGNNPAGHHFTSILLHSLNVAVLFLLLEMATGYLMRSAAVAALFAALPLNVESVAWIAERKTVLCTAFMLLTILAYGWFAKKPSLFRYACTAVLFALGLMAKPMLTPLPLGLLLLDYWPLERMPVPGKGNISEFLRNFSRLFAEKIPLLALSVASAWMTIHADRAGGAFAAASALPLKWRLNNAVYSCVAYIGKGVWPADLAVLYPHPEGSLRWWVVAGSIGTLLIVTVLAWRYREKKYLAAGWLWYLGMLFPVLGIIQSGRQGMADRYAYISFLGLFVAVVWLISDWADASKIKKAIPAAACSAVLVAYAAVTYHQIVYWKNSYTLFGHTLEVTKNNGLAEQNFGEALVEMRRPADATPHFEAAIRLIPTLAVAHYNLGLMRQMQNRLLESVSEYELALQYGLDPGDAAQAHNNLGMLFLQSGQTDSALKELNQAIALNPREQNSYIGRGLIEYRAGNFGAAAADFYAATRIAPSPIACFWLGRALEDSGEIERAKLAYQYALRLAPGLSDAKARLEALNGLASK
jgi:tetratricopeptide (TPR) repeat protein